MRGLMSFLTLCSLLSAQLAVLACPTAHHSEQTQAPASQSHHEHHAAAPVGQPANATDAPVSHHGDDNQCVMMLSCTAMAAARAWRETAVRSDLCDKQTKTPQLAYNNPALNAPTPPPKLA
jgi:hypothetical protein